MFTDVICGSIAKKKCFGKKQFEILRFSTLVEVTIFYVNSILNVSLEIKFEINKFEVHVSCR
jgi:hypothetical protein